MDLNDLYQRHQISLHLAENASSAPARAAHGELAADHLADPRLIGRYMANPMIAEMFYYKDMVRMLAYGSIAYACYFVSSFPIFYYLDEKPEDNWDLLRTTFAGLSRVAHEPETYRRYYLDGVRVV